MHSHLPQACHSSSVQPAFCLSFLTFICDSSQRSLETKAEPLQQFFPLPAPRDPSGLRLCLLCGWQRVHCLAGVDFCPSSGCGGTQGLWLWSHSPVRKSEELSKGSKEGERQQGWPGFSPAGLHCQVLVVPDTAWPREQQWQTEGWQEGAFSHQTPKF